MLPKQIRFWTRHGNVNAGLVMITLKQGQELHWHNGAYTDEGYCSIDVIYRFGDGDNFIVSERLERGRDCDGPYSTWVEVRAKIIEYPPYLHKTHSVFRVESYWNDHFNIEMPLWKKEAEDNRDIYAERMGY
jgi:hypothetical protein